MNEFALTKVERKTLEAIVLRFAEEPFAAEALERAFAGRLTGFEAELGIERLRERGIVETRRKAWGETIHSLAPGLFDDWQRHFVTAIADAALADGEAAPAYEPKAGLAKLVLFFLAETAHRGLALTQKGTFHKKDAARLAARIDASEASLRGLDIAYLHQDKLDKPLAVVFDAALRLGLARTGPASVAVDRSRLDEWLDTPLPDVERKIRKLWWDVYTPPDVWLQHGAAAIRNVPEGRWFSVDRLAEALLASGVPTGGRTAEAARDAIVAYWLEPMAAFGLAELGDSPDGAAARLPAIEPVDEAESQWYVQPDFEVIVPPAAPLRARWELEACADYAGGDAVDRYRITKESWERALAGGRDGGALLDFVRSRAAYGMPETVEASLRQWTSAYGAMTLEDVTLLRCRNAEDAAHVEADPAFAGCLVARLGELDFIVDRSKAKGLAETLKKQGFSVRTGSGGADAAGAGEREAADGDSLRTPASSGLVHSRRNAALFPLDPSPVGASRLRERIASVPQAWLRSLRKYHASTVRELVETAIEARTAVRLVVDGRQVELVPRRVTPVGGEWVVQGYIDGEETSVPSGACAEAQLLLPEQA